MEYSQQIMVNGFDGGDNKRINLIIAAATKFVDDVLDQVCMVLKLSDHSMRPTADIFGQKR